MSQVRDQWPTSVWVSNSTTDVDDRSGVLTVLGVPNQGDATFVFELDSFDRGKG